MPISVELLDSTNDPLTILYLSYKQCVTKRDLADLRKDINAGRITREKMLTFVTAQFDVGHTSPFYFLHFTFRIAGISRACANQLVRHHVGTAYEQQSLRIVDAAAIPVVYPPSVEEPAGPQRCGSYPHDDLRSTEKAGKFAYTEMQYNGVPEEDARYALPLGLETALLMDANLAALLHMADERLCYRAQWEIRKLFIEIRKCLIKTHPEFGRLLAPKCASNRLGYCNESLKAWQGCVLSNARPHKSQMLEWVRNWQKREIEEKDLEVPA